MRKKENKKKSIKEESLRNKKELENLYRCKRQLERLKDKYK